MYSAQGELQCKAAATNTTEHFGYYSRRGLTHMQDCNNECNRNCRGKKCVPEKLHGVPVGWVCQC